MVQVNQRQSTEQNSAEMFHHVPRSCHLGFFTPLSLVDCVPARGNSLGVLQCHVFWSGSPWTWPIVSGAAPLCEAKPKVPWGAPSWTSSPGQISLTAPPLPPNRQTAPTTSQISPWNVVVYKWMMLLSKIWPQIAHRLWQVWEGVFP